MTRNLFSVLVSMAGMSGAAFGMNWSCAAYCATNVDGSDALTVATSTADSVDVAFVALAKQCPKGVLRNGQVAVGGSSNASSYQLVAHGYATPRDKCIKN